MAAANREVRILRPGVRMPARSSRRGPFTNGPNDIVVTTTMASTWLDASDHATEACEGADCEALQRERRIIDYKIKSLSGGFESSSERQQGALHAFLTRH